MAGDKADPWVPMGEKNIKKNPNFPKEIIKQPKCPNMTTVRSCSFTIGQNIDPEIGRNNNFHITGHATGRKLLIYVE